MWLVARSSWFREHGVTSSITGSRVSDQWCLYAWYFCQHQISRVTNLNLSQSMYFHMYMCSCMHECARARTHARTRARAHTRARARAHTHTHTHTHLPTYSTLGMWPDFTARFVSESHSLPRLLGFCGYAWFVTAPNPGYQVTGLPWLYCRLLCGHIKTPVCMEVTC
jgi:hypothetical protein